MARRVGIGQTNLKKEEMITRAYEMRLSGMTYSQIATEMELTPMTIWRWVKKGIEQRHKPLEDEIRSIELDRFDRYLIKLEREIDKGNIKAIGMAIRISEARCRLLGIVAGPINVDNSVTVIQASSELQRTLDAARARLTGPTTAGRAIAGPESAADGSAGVVGPLDEGAGPVIDLGPPPYVDGEIIDMPSDANSYRRNSGS